MWISIIVFHSLPYIVYISFWICFWSFRTSSKFHCLNSHVKFFHQLQQWDKILSDSLWLACYGWTWTLSPCMPWHWLVFKLLVSCHSPGHSRSSLESKRDQTVWFPLAQIKVFSSIIHVIRIIWVFCMFVCLGFFSFNLILGIYNRTGTKIYFYILSKSRGKNIGIEFRQT